MLICLGAEPEGAAWNFRTQIVPVLSKAGCNAGACHGAASGQGGLHLSLLGYDPEEDYWAITHEFAGRRIDLHAPKESLVLQKSSHQIDHEGGRKLPRSSEGYATMLRWIEAGAPYGSPELGVTGISIAPTDQLLPNIGGQAQLRVTARFSDGSTKEVTRLALYGSNDDGIAEVNTAGLVTTRGRGLTSIMVRFSGQVAATRIAVPFGAAIANNNFKPRNFIDEEIGRELVRLVIPASELSDDAEFLRRASLDITGRLPEADQTRRWLASDPSATDREKLIDDLLQSSAFVDFWTLNFADLLLMSGKRGSEQATLAYHRWLKARIAENTPWDVMARALVTGAGDTTRDGPANFLTLATDPRDLSEYAGDIFLGAQIACARCHAHPNDRWTREDYYQFAAVFAQVRRDGNTIGRNPAGTLEHPKTKKVLAPKLLGGPEIIAQEGEPRAALAEWIADPRNPFFARAMVNRIWKQMLGRGLVEPVNDLRPTNPATHPRLLERLAESFVTNGFNLRWLIREIASSRTYQLSSHAIAGNSADNRFYSHAYFKPLPAQALVDAISQVTGIDEQFDSAPKTTRATQLIGAQTPSYALDVLGRCNRERACEPTGSGGGLAQALHLINGSTINGKLASGALSAMLRSGKSNREIIDEFYLRALCRRPARGEQEFWEQTFASIGNREEAAEDFVWTLLNSREFAYNH